MTEERTALFKDMCARLPYGIAVNHTNSNLRVRITKIDEYGHIEGECFREYVTFEPTDIYAVKIYLRPFSDMTGDERKEWQSLATQATLLNGETHYFINPSTTNYCFEHRIDCHGLIERGVAIATSINDSDYPYKDFPNALR